VHPSPKNQVIPMCPPYIPISNLLFQSIFDLLLSILQIELFGVMRKLVSKALTNLMAHFTFLAFKILTLWFSYVELLCLQVVSWKLAKPCRHGVSFQHCTSYLSRYHDLLFMDTRDVKQVGNLA
jgi:hypothetical protein